MSLPLLYFYDALCGWCYAFTPQVKALKTLFGDDLDINIISGGMVIGPNAGPLSPEKADYIAQAIPNVEEMSGVKFGDAFIQRLRQPELFYQSSLKPAIALSIVKEKKPESALDFASGLQQAQYYNGISLEEDTPYEHGFEGIGLPVNEMMDLMGSLGARAAATQDFRLSKELQIQGFPALVAYHKEQYYLLSHGFQRAEPIADNIRHLLAGK